MAKNHKREALKGLAAAGVAAAFVGWAIWHFGFVWPQIPLCIAVVGIMLIQVAWHVVQSFREPRG
jgi:hypothetical protein